MSETKAQDQASTGDAPAQSGERPPRQHAIIAGAEPIKLKDGQQLMKLTMKLGKGYPTRMVRVGVKWEHDETF